MHCGWCSLGGGVPGALEDCQGHETFEPCLWGMLPTWQGRSVPGRECAVGTEAGKDILHLGVG